MEELFQAAHRWNKLPYDIKCVQTLDSFKVKLTNLCFV